KPAPRSRKAAPVEEQAAPAPAVAKDEFEEQAAAPPPPRSRKKRVAADEDAPSRSGAAPDETTLADSDEPRVSKRLKSLDVAVGAHIYGRQFRYNQNLSGGAQE